MLCCLPVSCKRILSCQSRGRPVFQFAQLRQDRKSLFLSEAIYTRAPFQEFQSFGKLKVAVMAACAYRPSRGKKQMQNHFTLKEINNLEFDGMQRTVGAICAKDGQYFLWFKFTYSTTTVLHTCGSTKNLWECLSSTIQMAFALITHNE